MAVDIKVPDEVINYFIQLVLGESYMIIISLGILSLIIGFVFLTCYFVIKKGNPEKWTKINFLEKIVISIIFGVMMMIISGALLIIVKPFITFTTSYLNSLLIVTAMYQIYLFSAIENGRNIQLSDLKKLIQIMWNHVLVFGIFALLMKDYPQNLSFTIFVILVLIVIKIREKYSKKINNFLKKYKRLLKARFFSKI